MLKLIFCLFFVPSVFLHSSMTLKFFSKKPPYELSSFYPLKLETPIKSLEEITSSKTCYITINDKNKALKEKLPLVKLPRHKTILWIGSSKKQCQLLETLTKEGNTIKTLFSKKKEIIENTYLEIQPDIILLPLHLKKNLETLVLKYPSQKKLLAMFYPSEFSARNFIVTLSSSALQKKIFSCKLSKKTIEALAYDFLSVPTETFLLKKLTLTSEGKVLLKKEKQQIFNAEITKLLPKRFHPISISSQDKILAIGKSFEDLKLALGGFFYELEKQNISTSMHTKTFSNHLESALSSCTGSLYLFTAEKASYNKILLKKLKDYLKKHPDKSIFVGYYKMPWHEEWNLYHYHSDIGSPLVASIGLSKLSKNNNLSLEVLGGAFAECYLLKNFLKASFERQSLSLCD